MALFKDANASFIQPPKFPFVFNTRANDPNLFNSEPVVFKMVPDEEFIWITHSVMIPNVVPFRYLVSNYGRVWDCLMNKEVPTQDNGNGYIKLKLAHYINWNQVSVLDVYMHRLVAFYFLYEPFCEKLEVNHINGVKSDNRVANLEWVTRVENINHAMNTGLYKIAQDHWNASLSNEQVEEICKLIMVGKTNREIANITNTDINIIISIRNGQNYKSVTSKYNLDVYRVHIHNKLSDSEVKMICEMLCNERYSLDDICNSVGCTKSQIKDIKYNGAYRHISKYYRIEEYGKRGIVSFEKEKQIRKACEYLEKGYQPAEIAKMKGITLTSKEINTIKGGSAYTNICKDYNIPKPVKREGTPEEKVREICELLVKYGYTKTADEIAREVGVTVDVVKHIRNKKIYKNIVSEYNIPAPAKAMSKPLEENKVREVCNYIQKFPNMEIRKLSSILGLAEYVIGKIKNRQSYTDISKDYKW